MPIKLKFTVGNDTFEAEGDFAFDEGLESVVSEWTRALGPEANQDDVDAVTKKMRQQTDALDAAVQANSGNQSGV
jgi:hypothetical protein